MADTRLQRARKVVAENFEKIKAAFAALLALPGKFFGYLTGRDVATSSVIDVVEPVQENSPSFFSRTFSRVTSAPSALIGKIRGLFVKADGVNPPIPEADTNQATPPSDHPIDEHAPITEAGTNQATPPSAHTIDEHAPIIGSLDATNESDLNPTALDHKEEEANPTPSVLSPEQTGSPASASTEAIKRSRFLHLTNPFRSSPKSGLADGGLEGHPKPSSEKGSGYSGVHKGISGFFAGKRKEYQKQDAAKAAAAPAPAVVENTRSSSSPKNSGS